MSSHGVTIHLEVKGSDRSRIKAEVARRVAESLNKWFLEEPRQPPYPEGTLLYWNIQVGSEHGVREPTGG